MKISCISLENTLYSVRLLCETFSKLYSLFNVFFYFILLILKKALSKVFKGYLAEKNQHQPISYKIRVVYRVAKTITNQKTNFLENIKL